MSALPTQWCHSASLGPHYYLYGYGSWLNDVELTEYRPNTLHI